MNSEVAFEKAAENIVLHAAIYTDDFLWSAFVGCHFLGGYLVNEVVFIWIVVVGVFAFFHDDFAEEGTVLADFLGEQAGVDTGNCRDLVFDEPFTEGFVGIPMAVVLRIFIYD